MRSLEDLDVAARRVLVRADLNVPLDEGCVRDPFRIEAFRPTLEHLIEAGAKPVVCSHLGRPKQWEAALSMRPVADYLSRLLGSGVVLFVEDVAGSKAQEAASGLETGRVLVLENLRFEPGETSNDPAFAQALSSLGERYVNDAFGSCHRAHASIVGPPARLPSAAGFLLASELDNLGRLLSAPPAPFVVVLGGAKVADKIGVVKNLSAKAARVLIGGGMCFTFLAARGLEVGRSLLDEERVSECEQLLKQAGDKIMLPSDVVVSESVDAGEGRVVPAERIPAGQIGVDIGPDTAADFAEVIRKAGSLFWNGPMGVAEHEPFARGTRAVGRAVVQCDGYTVTGGGDTAAILSEMALGEADFASTGGGAALEFLEGRRLPGLQALEESA